MTEHQPKLPRAYIAVVLALITYASLYPFDFHPGALVDALRGDWTGTILHARSGPVDTVANFFFYLPLGYMLVATGCRPEGLLGRLALCGLVGTVTSFSMEVLQFAVPSRSPSIVDISLNALGAILGGAIGHATAGFRLKHQRPDWLRRSGTDAVAVAVAIGWFALKAAPFIPQLGLYRVKQSLQPLLNLDWSVEETASQFALYLIALAAIRTLVRRNHFWAFATFSCLGALCCQVLIVRHQLTFGEVVACALALLQTGNMRQMRTSSTLPIVFILTLICMLVAGLSPYRFSVTAQAFHWVPFATTLDSQVDSGFFALMRKLVLYGGCWWAGMRGIGRLGATLSLLLVTTLIEFLQVFVPGRQAEITDPLLVLMIALAFSGTWVRSPRLATAGRNA